MKTNKLMIASILISLFMLVAGSSVSFAAHHEEQKTSASDVQKEAMETYDTLKDYTLEQRDEVMTAAKQKIEKIDARIAEMQRGIDAKWQEMNKDAQVKARRTEEALRQKRQDLAEWLGGIRYGSKDAWEEVKKGFSDSYDRLEEAFMQARKDLQKDNQQ